MTGQEAGKEQKDLVVKGHPLTETSIYYLNNQGFYQYPIGIRNIIIFINRLEEFCGTFEYGYHFGRFGLKASIID